MRRHKELMKISDEAFSIRGHTKQMLSGNLDINRRLGHDIAHICFKRLAILYRATYTFNQQVGNDAGIKAAGPKCNNIRLAYGIEHILKGFRV